MGYFRAEDKTASADFGDKIADYSEIWTDSI